METQTGLDGMHLESQTKMLTILLADELVLYVKTGKYQWDGSGVRFMAIHALLESQYTKLEEMIDEVAERIGKLGEKKTIGTLQEFSSLTTLPVSPDKHPPQDEMLKELLSNHESIISILRREIDAPALEHTDADKAAFLTAVLQTHETMARELRRNLH